MHPSTRNKLKHFGLQRYCPVCKSFLRYFKSAGKTGRRDAVCPVCGSFERHRLIWLYFHAKTPLFTASLKVLHAAPENCFVRRLKSLSNLLSYHSIDLFSPLADHRMSLTELTYPDEMFDFFYCSHVLEHIPNDGKAISEIFRVLKPGGTAVIMVPISGERTREDASVTSPEERRRLYGQDDHVRIYGEDFGERLETHGFIVRREDYYSQFSRFMRRYLGLLNEPFFHCFKPYREKNAG